MEVRWKVGILLCLLVWVVVIPTAEAVAQLDTAQHQEVALVPVGAQLKQSPVGVELFQVDRELVSNREPLLLVHGLNGEHVKQCHWTKVIAALTANTDFRNTYKIYLVRYKTNAPMAENVPQFQKTLLSLYEIAGNKPITIVALSLGGNMAEEAMLDPAVNKTVCTVMTFGAPFHGTPLFTPDWFQYSLYKNPSIHWARVFLSVAFNIYFSHRKALTQDLGWDNSDGLMPDVGPFHSKVPFGPKGRLKVAEDSNVRLLKLNSELSLDKSKFITYAGYLHNPFMYKQCLPTRLGNHIFEPFLHVVTIVPLLLAREHPVLKSTNWSLSRMICKQAPGSPCLNAYALNDGVSPVVSALFLSNEFCRTHVLCDEASLSQLHGAIDVGKARVFGNIDHVTFIDCKHPWFTSRQLQDQLHPEEGQRTIFDWILSDLMNPIGHQKSAQAANSFK